VNAVVMTNRITINILMAIAIGAAIAIALVLMIALFRVNQRVNSLVDTQDYVDAIVTVRTPFNGDTIGSVWIEQAGHRIVMTAQTHDRSTFLRGDQAVVVEVWDGKVWVSHTDQVWPS